MVAILQHLADIAYALYKGIIRYRNSPPDFLKQLLFRYWPSWVFRQIAQHFHRLRPQRKMTAIARKRAAVRVERIFFKLENMRKDVAQPGPLDLSAETGTFGNFRQFSTPFRDAQAPFQAEFACQSRKLRDSPRRGSARPSGRRCVNARPKGVSIHSSRGKT